MKFSVIFLNSFFTENAPFFSVEARSPASGHILGFGELQIQTEVVHIVNAGLCQVLEKLLHKFRKLLSSN